MIYSLSGRLLIKEPTAIVVECGGVGYKCGAPMSTVQSLPSVGEQVTVFTHMNVREDAIELFAFADEDELGCFRKLISVSGVGGKVALSILTHIPADKLQMYVITEDIKAITQAQGVGAKLAKRIVLELKDKLDPQSIVGGVSTGELAGAMSGTAQSEAISALVALGYSPSEAATAVAGLDPTLSVEEIIRTALRQIAKGS